MRRAFLGILCLAILLTFAGCGEKTVIPESAEESVVDVVSEDTGFRPDDVSCPSDVKAEAGKTFNCQFTGPEGEPYIARMRITDVEGERVEFYVATRPR
jgi:predicted small lipoprotein YifL